mgnify:FL=1
MISKWYGLKEKALALRKRGFSIRNIELRLGIPRSTLSGWVKNIKLSKNQKKALRKNFINGLITARKLAVIWHNQQKENRLSHAKNEAEKILEKIDISNKEIAELSLAMLYLGEGFKKKSVTGVGNSDPLILILFISLVKKIYSLKKEDFVCNLHLRADQNPEELISYWSKILKIPKINFGKSSIDKRTLGSKTYSDYRGVCVVRCGNVAIQRKLVYLSRTYCEKIIASCESG